MQNVVYFEKLYKYVTAEEELTIVEKKAMLELSKNNRLQPASLIYSKDMQYWLSLVSFKNQDEAKRVVVQLLREKQCDFYIVVGITRTKHPFDADQDQFWLNIILNKQNKVQWRKLELLFSGDTVTVLKREQFDGHEDKDVDIIKDMLKQEDITDEDQPSEHGCNK